jgi:hypothetical protein
VIIAVGKDQASIVILTVAVVLLPLESVNTIVAGKEEEELIEPKDTTLLVVLVPLKLEVTVTALTVIAILVKVAPLSAAKDPKVKDTSELPCIIFLLSPVIAVVVLLVSA